MWRTSLFLILAALLLAAGPLRAQDECMEALQDLRAKIAPDSGASWEEMHSAYQLVKDHVARHEECAKAYKEMQPDVARALRRERVPLGGWVMGIFGACLLWGGFTYCVGIARRTNRVEPPPE